MLEGPSLEFGGVPDVHDTALVCIPAQVPEHSEKAPTVHLQADKTNWYLPRGVSTFMQ